MVIVILKLHHVFWFTEHLCGVFSPSPHTIPEWKARQRAWFVIYHEESREVTATCSGSLSLPDVAVFQSLFAFIRSFSAFSGQQHSGYKAKTLGLYQPWSRSRFTWSNNQK
jgi:hypothetical protein